MQAEKENSYYDRYHIKTQLASDIVKRPSRFKVKVGKVALAKQLVREFIHYQGDLDVVLSRPCVYGVFSGPVGGFAPREELCVGCLRCTTQHPEFVRILPNPEHRRLGDDYFTFDKVDTVSYEARTGRIPVKGAGYRGLFGGFGWDGMWTDMSEIVRPTRDGIHGREYISTVVDIGPRPDYLAFDKNGQLIGEKPSTFSLPLPMLLDKPPLGDGTQNLPEILARTAGETGTLAILPIQTLLVTHLRGPQLVPLIRPSEINHLTNLSFTPAMVEMDGWDPELKAAIERRFPEAIVGLRLSFSQLEDLIRFVELGVRVFHLTANYHGRIKNGNFILDLIRSAHMTLVEARMRDPVTLIGSGGIIAAEHVPKAIIAGLDLVALDTPLLVALQAQFTDQLFEPDVGKSYRLAANLRVDWGVQRSKNLMAAWRDQLLEVLGAMGIREVRRLRGEVGRAMFAADLEREAFDGIKGFARELEVPSYGLNGTYRPVNVITVSQHEVSFDRTVETNE